MDQSDEAAHGHIYTQLYRTREVQWKGQGWMGLWDSEAEEVLITKRYGPQISYKGSLMFGKKLLSNVRDFIFMIAEHICKVLLKIPDRPFLG